MPPESLRPTPYPDVNAALQELSSGALSVLGSRFVGLYLHGSLAGGDFNPRTSDVDFLVVTADELPAEIIPALAAMHARMTAGGSSWATELEGSYIPRHSLRRYDPSRARHPHVERGGELRVELHDSDWVIQRHVLRERGIVVAGPAIRPMIDPVQPDELRQAVRELLAGWWAAMLRDDTRLRMTGYQPYAVLTMCRMLYTLQYGTIVSKPAAARWAKRALGSPWAGLIERASTPEPIALSHDVNETQQFIRYTLERSRPHEVSTGYV